MTCPICIPDSAQAADWQTRLAAMGRPGLRVGLVWAGSSRLHSPTGAALDSRRSIAPERLAPLVAVPGLHFVSLQKDGPAAPADFALTNVMSEMGDFADTAALVADLDLVISVDTAVAHLAGALGRPVWLLDRFDPCWRWLLGRRDSPWYPTLRLSRQPEPGNWQAVIDAVQAELAALAGGGAGVVAGEGAASASVPFPLVPSVPPVMAGLDPAIYPRSVAVARAGRARPIRGRWPGRARP